MGITKLKTTGKAHEGSSTVWMLEEASLFHHSESASGAGVHLWYYLLNCSHVHVAKINLV